MKNLFRIFWDSSTVERWRNHLGLNYKLEKSVPKKFKIAMAVLAYERPNYLKVSLDSLFKTKLYDYDITFFLSDDGSNDPEVRRLILKERNPEFKIVRWFFPKGPNSAGAAINRTMKKVLEYGDFDIVGWADPDVLYHPEWLKHTFEVCLWAKEHHRDYNLGPFTSFNSSDFVYHRILGQYDSPHGKYLVKRQAGMLNYFYFRKDFEKLGNFTENLDDEAIMTNKFESLKIRNFCPEVSYIEHIGQESILNRWRPNAYTRAMFALHPANGGWDPDYQEFRKFEPQYYQKIEAGYQAKLNELETKAHTSLTKRLLKTLKG